VNKHIPAAAAGIVLLGLALSSGAGTAWAGTAGTRDATFGSGGIVVTNLGADPFGNAIQGNVSAAALQSDGDIVVSVVNTATGDSGLLRYLPNGTMDTTFGNGGFAAFPADANPAGGFSPKLAVQSDDKILAATQGIASNGSGETARSWSAARPCPAPWRESSTAGSSASPPTAPWTRASASPGRC
jgi:Domain of unknown function (DUF5122) beta-propeller